MHFVLKRLDGTWTAEDERFNVRLSCGLHRRPNCAWNNQGNRHTAAKNPYPRMAMDSSLCVESMVLMMPQNFCMKNFNLFLCSSIFPATSIATFKRRKLCTAVEHFFILDIFGLLTSVAITFVWKSLVSVYLFEEGLECIVTCLLHLSVDVSTALRHDLKQCSVVVHKAAAELGCMSGQ